MHGLHRGIAQPLVPLLGQAAVKHLAAARMTGVVAPDGLG